MNFVYQHILWKPKRLLGQTGYHINYTQWPSYYTSSQKRRLNVKCYTITGIQNNSINFITTNRKNKII